MKLQEVAQIVDCEHKTAPITPNGQYFAVGTPAMRGNSINYSQARPISAKTFQEWTRRLKPRAGDILFAREAPVGPVVQIPAEENIAPGQRTVLIRPGENIHGDYLFYLLTTPWMQRHVSSVAAGSTVPHLNVSDIRSLLLGELPDLNAQRSVGAVLRSLDDKIAANHRVIRTSIELAESLVSRSLTTGYTRLSDIATVTMGTSPKGEFLSEEITGLPFYQGVRDFGEITPHQRIYTENPVREAEPGDILFAVRAPVGEVNIASEHTAIGRGLAAIRGVEHHNALFYLLRSRPEIWNMHQGSGTVFASINKTDLANASIPEIEMDSTDSSLLDELHREALTLTNQNITLAKTRDELLPLLMSGKITVREASQEAAAAGAPIPGEENEV